jgi:predicted metal-dependent phosphoesterase TrpH
MMEHFTIELHCHTHYSKDSLLDPVKLLELCKVRRIDKVAITDHDTIEGALEASELDPERVIIGEEIMTTQGELLGYFMKAWIPPGLSPQETIARLRDQGAFISVSHPFDGMRSGSWQEENLREILDLVDAIEVFNARTWTKVSNDKATSVANKAGLLRTAGSDAHALLEVGRVTMSLPAFDGVDGFRSSLSQAQIHGKRSSILVHLFSRYASFRKKIGWSPKEI